MKFDKLKYKHPLGKVCYQLFNPEYGFFEPYKEYLDSLISTSQNNINAKAQDLKVFFEYLTCFDTHTVVNKIDPNKNILEVIILFFPEYLAMAQDSRIDFISYIAKSNDREPISYVSSKRLISSVNAFLSASAMMNMTILKMNETDFVNISVQKEALFEQLLSRGELNKHEKVRLLRDSVLASVVKGGARYSSSKSFAAIRPHGGRTPSQGSKGAISEEAFPFQLTKKLLDNSPNHRERCLWALLLGTGIRVSEALQILFEDIDIEKETVKIIDYRLRKPKYSCLSDDQESKLEFKGRCTEETWFIEPFKTIFFDNYWSYLQDRKKTGAAHNIVFVSLSNANAGIPLIGSDEPNNHFKKAQVDMGMNKVFTLHTTRHFYGVWCRNYIKYCDKPPLYGLPLSTVSKMMGHSSTKSTEIYAVIDKILLRTAITYANKLLSTKPDLTAVALFAMESELKKIRSNYENI